MTNPIPPETTDAELVRRARRDEPGAFEPVQRFRRPAGTQDVVLYERRG